MKRNLLVIFAIAALVTALIRLIPGDWCGEYVVWRTASELLLERKNPYDSELEFEHQTAIRISLHGTGISNLVPYFKLPWFALAFAPLCLLPPWAGQIAWGFLGSLELVLAGWLLADVGSGLSRAATVALCVAFPLSLLVNWMGQISPLVLLLTVVYWRLADAKYDFAAGGVLAYATFKPQIVVALVALVFLQSIHQRRWRIIAGFCATLLALGLVSALFVPNWPLEFLRNIQRHELPTDERPEIGVTWSLLLRTAGASGWQQVVGYAVVALATVCVAVYWALKAEASSLEMVAYGMLAGFFLSPYAQVYDFPVLIPAMLVAFRQLPPIVVVVSISALVLGLYFNLYALAALRWPPITMFWLPAVLMIALALPVVWRALNCVRPAGDSVNT